MQLMATPSEKTVSLSTVVMPIRLSELVRTHDPTFPERFGRECCLSLSNNLTVPSTPPLNTMPRQVCSPFCPSIEVDVRHLTRYPSDPSCFPKGRTSKTSVSDRIDAPCRSAR